MTDPILSCAVTVGVFTLIYKPITLSIMLLCLLGEKRKTFAYFLKCMPANYTTKFEKWDISTLFGERKIAPLLLF